MYFFDTETCGFHGPTITIQYAQGEGPVTIHEVWRSPIYETLELIESMCAVGVVGFNLVFDWFHICQTYTVLQSMLSEGVCTKHDTPDDLVNLYFEHEGKARFLDICLKPAFCSDVMLQARKGLYQSTMDRKDINIRRVPSVLAYELAEKLNEVIKLKDIYFTKQVDKKKRWTVVDTKNEAFKNVVLKFKPSSALKVLATDALNIPEATFYNDVALPKKCFPEECGYAPFQGSWPEVIHMHIDHWGYSNIARNYAIHDVIYTRDLYKHFGSPEPNDDDSILACMVGASRWHGYAINSEALLKLKERDTAIMESIPFNFNSSELCSRYLCQVMSPTEQVCLKTDSGNLSTKAVILEDIMKWRVEEVCPDCNGQGCHKCEDGLVKTDQLHEAAKRAKQISDARKASNRIHLFEKLLKAGRFHSSFDIIGALSNRMSGSGGDLNAQGINKVKDIRSCFPLADSDMVLCGGDFDAFEITLMDAAYGDEQLRKDLKSGKKLHGLFGEGFFPGHTYEEILASDGLPGDKDLYTRSKRGTFGILYGGNEETLARKVGIPISVGLEAYQSFVKRYPTWGAARTKIFDMFCTMKQTGGIGSRVEWVTPCDYIESMYGFKRYFTLENQICKALFDLAESPPPEWNKIKVQVMRRDRFQTTGGAVRSALFASAFSIQAANMRAAANHVIQSSGASITKKLQCTIWSVQDVGVSTWKVQPLNVHDEIMCPTKPDYVNHVETLVNDFIEQERVRVPLIGMKWKTNLKSWADK